MWGFVWAPPASPPNAFVGIGGTKQQRPLLRLLAPMGIHHRVFHLGLLGERKVLGAWGRCDTVLFSLP